MREIKFRGQHAGNLRWYYGGYHKHEVVTVCPLDNTPIEYQHLIVQSGFGDWNLPKPIQAVEVIPETVGQYTGLLDKNGKEIYEGDILRCFSKTDKAEMVVIFEDGEFRMVLTEKYHAYTTGFGFYAIRNFDKEVIGNIHDNPELLEVEK